MKQRIFSFKRVLSLLLAVVLFATVTVVPLPVKADTAKMLTFYHVNPLYENIAEQPLLLAATNEPLAAADTYYNLAGAGAVLRDAMEARLASVDVGYVVNGTGHTNAQIQQYAVDLFNEAIKHTGEPTEGDYIRWHYKGYGGNIHWEEESGKTYFTYTFTLSYLSTAQQEQQMNSAVNTLLSSLNVWNASDYEKVCAIYDYICDNITYDYAGLNAGDEVAHTAYAALIRKRAVCQGYASLFYRLALSLDVDARLIAGIGAGGRHGWNIVELGGKYYNLDSTWDAGRENYGYFLKCEANFDDHDRFDEYKTAAFHAAYPMSSTDYVPCAHAYSWVTDKAATCSASGLKHEECSKCHEKRKINTVIPATGNHNYQWVEDKAATCQDGKKHEECTVCHTIRNAHTVIPATKAHKYRWVEDKAATCQDGKKHEECSVCGVKRNVNTVIPGTGIHDYHWVVTRVESCDKDGLKQDKCIVCGIVRDEMSTPATGDHLYDNDNDIECNMCGYVREILYTGWDNFFGKWYYYEEGNMVKNAWRKDSKGWVYLGADGAMLTNKWVKDSKGWCYVGADGYILINKWVKDSKGWCYVAADGRMVYNKWVKTSGKWYYCDANGYMVANKWMKDSKGWVRLGSNGAMLTNKWTTDSKGWCYVGADGYAVTNTWKKDSVGWCYLDSNGSMTKSAWVKTGGYWYYCNANGYMLANTTASIGGKKYTFNVSGVWIK